MSEMRFRLRQAIAILYATNNHVHGPNINDLITVVLTTLREPTELMERAGQAETYDHMTNAKTMWRAMIDEALKP